MAWWNSPARRGDYIRENADWKRIFPQPRQTTQTGPYSNPFASRAAGSLMRNPTLDYDYFNNLDLGGPQAAFSLFTDNVRGPAGLKKVLEGIGQKGFWDKYAAAQADDPALRWIDYLSGLDLNQIYRQATPWDRGERASTFAPRMRWIG